MEIELKYADDVIKEYADSRPTLREEDIEDLMRIFIKYLNMKMKLNESYAIATPMGIFYKKLNKDMFDKVDNPATKEQILNEKIFLNNCLKKELKTEYLHEDLEKIKNHTNNHPIKT